MNQISDKHFLPIYEQIASYLREEILEGRLTYESKLPPEPDLARQFNSSRETLRKAFSILEAQNLIAKRKGKGTFIVYQKPGKELEKKRVGIFSANSFAKSENSDSYYGQLFQGISSGFFENGLEAVFYPLENSIMDVYQQENLDALMIINPVEPEAKKLKKLSMASIPHVILSVSYDFLREKFICLDTDNLEGSRKITRYLLELGHRQIAYLGTSWNTGNATDRLKGYRQAFKECNPVCDESLIFNIKAGQDASGCHKVISRLKAENKLPTAIFAGGFSLALETYKVLKNLNLKIPDDISVAGFDDYMFCRYMEPPLTTVKQPVYELGRKAVELLNRQINHRKFEYGLTLLDTEFIIRESCRKIN